MSGGDEMFGGLEAVAASLAVLITVLLYVFKRRARQAELTIDIWKVWASKDYRGYRVAANRAIKKERQRAGKSRPSMIKILNDAGAEEAIGSVEHIFSELAEITAANLIDRKLLDKLFARSAIQWREILSDIDREGADCHPWDELDAAFSIIIPNDADLERKNLRRYVSATRLEGARRLNPLKIFG